MRRPTAPEHSVDVGLFAEPNYNLLTDGHGTMHEVAASRASSSAGEAFT